MQAITLTLPARPTLLFNVALDVAHTMYDSVLGQSAALPAQFALVKTEKAQLPDNTPGIIATYEEGIRVLVSIIRTELDYGTVYGGYTQFMYPDQPTIVLTADFFVPESNWQVGIFNIKPLVLTSVAETSE